MSLCCHLQVKAASKYVDVPVSDNNPFFFFFGIDLHSYADDQRLCTIR